jgi:hypothetical protein
MQGGLYISSTCLDQLQMTAAILFLTKLQSIFLQVGWIQDLDRNKETFMTTK